MLRRRLCGNPNLDPTGHVSVVFDKTTQSPENITISDSQKVLDSILSKFRRCLCKKTANGEVSICYLDDKNSNYFEDGRPTSLGYNDGDVMVNFPEFWYKYTKIDSKHFSYMFSLQNIDDTWKHVDRSLVGAYKSYIENASIARSISGVYPTTGISFWILRSIIESRGSGYQMIDFQQHCVIAFMLYARYRTLDLQSVLGVGEPSSPISKTGESNATGIADTKNENSKCVCGLGIEGVFGGLGEYMKGVFVNDNYWTITDPDGVTRNVYGSGASGWIRETAAEYGPFFDLVPTNINGEQGKYYTDYYWQADNTSDTIVSRLEAHSNGAHSYEGVACLQANHSKTINYHDACSRIAFRGLITEVESSEEFESLPFI